MENENNINRRDFLKKSAGAAAFTLVSPYIMSAKFTGEKNEKIKIAFIGCGTQGLRQLMQHIVHPEVLITAVCDPNRDSRDYINWRKDELADKIRIFLNDDNWEKGKEGVRAGRLVAKHIVERYYRSQNENVKVSDYADYRELLEKEKDIDAVYIMTPDHSHAPIAAAAMKLGKHVIMHKPLAITVEETRYIQNLAKKSDVITHMFCAADRHTTPLLSEWIWDGAIGDVTDVYNWSARPYWPQGMYETPEAQKIPEGLDWDIWLGTAEQREFSPKYTHSLFRGWRDFGTGALGDMGHYSFKQIFEILKLDVPISVEASTNKPFIIKDTYWEPAVSDIAYPNASRIKFDFGKRNGMGPLSIHWSDGSLRPSLPDELEVDGRQMPVEGMLLVGTEGKILADFSGGSPRIIPESEMKKYKRPQKYLERPEKEFDQWVNAIKTGKRTKADFIDAAKLTETICLGNIAMFVEGKHRWNKEKMEFENSQVANKYLSRKIRKGWEYMDS